MKIKHIIFSAVVAALAVPAAASQPADLNVVAKSGHIAVPRTADAGWTEWTDYATATFDAQWWYRKPMENLKVMRRQSTSNADMVQFKVCGMFGDTPGCPPVDLIIGTNFGVQGPTARDVAAWVDDQYIESYDLYGDTKDIYLCDGYTYYDTFFPTDPDYAYAYEDATYFRPETGTFTIYSYYHYPNGDVPFLDAFYQDQAHGIETLRLIGPEFKNYTPEIADGKFEKVGDTPYYLCNVKIHDLSKVKMTVVGGSSIDARTVATGMHSGSVDHITVTADGEAKVPFDGMAGAHTLVYLTYDAEGNTYQFGQVALQYEPDWKALGTGTFTDGFISKFLEGDMHNNMGLFLDEEEFTYPVDVQESTVTPGRYRLVNPYGSTSPYWDLSFSVLNLNKKETHYLYIDATDADHVHIEYSDCGFYYGSEPLVLYSEAHDWLAEGYALADIPENLWGKLKDGVITFDAGSENDNLLSAKIMTSAAAISGRELVVKLPAAAIADVAADSADSPAEYYNLQGIRVANPAPGQLYIRRQGHTATKVIL